MSNQIPFRIHNPRNTSSSDINNMLQKVGNLTFFILLIILHQIQ